MRSALIVPYQSRHRDAVTALLRAAVANGELTLPDGAGPDAAHVGDWFDQHAAGVLVGEHDGETVGFVLLAPPGRPERTTAAALESSGVYNPAAVIELLALVVVPGRRRSGVGAALLRAAARSGWEHGYRPALHAPTGSSAAALCHRDGWSDGGEHDGRRVFLAPHDRSSMTGFVRSGVRDGGVGAVATGIEVSTTFSMTNAGQPGEFDYARAQNPTRKALEEALAVAEGAAHAMAFSSGLAAIDTMLRLLSPGERVIVGTDAYGGTWRLLDKVWSRHGVGVDVADVTDPDAVAAVWGPRTRMLIVETPSNPALQIADIAALAALAHTRNGFLAVDNTFATPWLQRPLRLGADIVVHSATKYIGGHSDVIAGALMTDDGTLADEFRFSQKAVGAVPGPFDSFLVLRGLRTLPLRVERQCRNALLVAEMLETHPAVDRVFYPGLVSHPGHDLAMRQMGCGGAMVSFTVAGGETAAKQTAERTRLFTLAESLGAVESLIEHPASMTHAANNGSQLAVDPALLRLSVGIEDGWALLADLRQALPER